jgi:hypothetical protein
VVKRLEDVWPGTDGINKGEDYCKSSAVEGKEVDRKSFDASRGDRVDSEPWENHKCHRYSIADTSNLLGESPCVAWS